MSACRCGHQNAPGALRCEACDAWLDTERTPLPDAPLAEGTRQRRASSDAAPADGSEMTLIRAVPYPDEEDDSRSATVRPHCPGCGVLVGLEWRFCTACGAALPADEPSHTVPVAALSQAPTRPRSHTQPLGRERAARSGPRHVLVHLGAHGVPGPTHELRSGRTIVGRTDGDLVEPEDGTLSGRHAAFDVRGSRCFVCDLQSTNGTFVSVSGVESLSPGDVLLVGSQRLVFRVDGRGGHELIEMHSFGREGRRFPLRKDRIVIGKSQVDVAYPDDEFVSRRHAEIVRLRRGFALRDLSSTNRTYRIIVDERELHSGDRVVIGSQVFEYRCQA